MRVGRSVELRVAALAWTLVSRLSTFLPLTACSSFGYKRIGGVNLTRLRRFLSDGNCYRAEGHVCVCEPGLP
jgi:hypothetical protein